LTDVGCGGTSDSARMATFLLVVRRTSVTEQTLRDRASDTLAIDDAVRWCAAANGHDIIRSCRDGMPQ
jgi:hypothetical protein